MDFVRSGIRYSTSTFWVIPNPLHVSHAPKGALKENNRGSSLGMLNPQYLQE